jgi:hypothetical protein
MHVTQDEFNSWGFIIGNTRVWASYHIMSLEGEIIDYLWDSVCHPCPCCLENEVYLAFFNDQCQDRDRIATDPTKFLAHVCSRCRILLNQGKLVPEIRNIILTSYRDQFDTYNNKLTAARMKK